MSAADALQLAGQFPLVAYLIWSEQRRDKQRTAERAEEAERQERDITSREKLASAMTQLSIFIQGGGRVNV